jgi:hypothetical protein
MSQDLVRIVRDFSAFDMPADVALFSLGLKP